MAKKYKNWFFAGHWDTIKGVKYFRRAFIKRGGKAIYPGYETRAEAEKIAAKIKGGLVLDHSTWLKDIKKYDPVIKIDGVDWSASVLSGDVWLKKPNLPAKSVAKYAQRSVQS